MRTWIFIVAVIAAIGAINWGLVGFFNWNLVDAIFGADPVEETTGAARIVYALVGLSGLALLFSIPAIRTEQPTRTRSRGEVYP